MATETIYSLFRTVADAERAIGALIDHGIDRDLIGIIARQPAEQDETFRVREDYVRIADPTGVDMGEPVASYTPKPSTPPPATIPGTALPTSPADTASSVESAGKEGITTTTAADAGVGAAIGTGVGLIAGLLVSAAAITIPGVGIVLAAGAVASAIGATVATTAAGAIAGGVAGYLVDLGMDEAAATSYAERISEGDYLLAVDVDTADYDEVRRILYKYNAVSVDLKQPTSGQLGAPTPVRRIVTEEENGTPIIPAREIEEVPPSSWRMTPEESEAALDRDTEVEDQVQSS